LYLNVADGNAGITMLNLYAAGTETTSTALTWAWCTGQSSRRNRQCLRL